MIKRSVPGYEQVLNLLPTLVRTLGRKMAHVSDLRFYDLGCSLGASLASISLGLDKVNAKTVHLTGIDNSSAMIKKAKVNLGNHLAKHPPRSHPPLNLNLSLQEADIVTTRLEPCQMVVMHYTLQFIKPELRKEVLDKIYTALEPGGYLVLSEKIRFEDNATNQLLTDIHHRFKQDQGYSELEISQKRDAIEKVLIPESLTTHVNRLSQCGFTTVTPWVQNFQFISILAVK